MRSSALRRRDARVAAGDRARAVVDRLDVGRVAAGALAGSTVGVHDGFGGPPSAVAAAAGAAGEQAGREQGDPESPGAPGSVAGLERGLEGREMAQLLGQPLQALEHPVHLTLRPLELVLAHLRRGRRAADRRARRDPRRPEMPDSEMRRLISRVKLMS